MLEIPRKIGELILHYLQSFTISEMNKTTAMTAKIKELFHKDCRKQESCEDSWLLISDVAEENGVDTGIQNNNSRNTDRRKHSSSLSLPSDLPDHPEPAEIQHERYKRITRKLSQEMQNFVPSPQMMRKRRNATCDEIEKKTITDMEGHTLRDDRVDMLKVVALKEMNLI